MLRLAEHVCSHPGRIGPAVGQDQDLAGPRDRVDVHLDEDLALGHLDPAVARTHDLVHRPDRLRSIGQGGHGLGAPDLEDPVHAAQFHGQGHQGVEGPPPEGRHRNDLLHPGDPGRNGGHNHGGRVSGQAAGDVNTHPFQGGEPLTDPHPVFLFVHPVRRQLPAVKPLHPGRGQRQYLPVRRGHQGSRSPYFLPGQLYRCCIQIITVESQSIFKNRFIPPKRHLPDDVFHRHPQHLVSAAAVHDAPEILRKSHFVRTDQSHGNNLCYALTRSMAAPSRENFSSMRS